MTKRRLSRILVSAALVLLTALPVLGQSRHEPKSEPPGNRVQVRTPPPSPPPRQAAPRSSARADRQPQREPQRQPQPGDDHVVVRHPDHFPYYYGRYRWYPWGWWGGWGYPYGPYYPWGMGAYWYPEQVRPDMGALDLDIRPEKARVYLDGHMIGIADNFDGWPRHLWLEEGTYDLVFYHEGYETIARQYTIYPGLVIDVEDRMIEGEAVLPEDLLAKSSANREERLRRRLERGEEVGTPGDWRDRVRREREGVSDEAPAYDARTEPARLRLSVQPPDAAVYLDGRFLGTGEELGQVRAGLIVDAGEHELQVTRPGYEPETTTFEAEAGEEVELTVELEESD
jgi:hypothetical protein